MANGLTTGFFLLRLVNWTSIFMLFRGVNKKGCFFPKQPSHRLEDKRNTLTHGLLKLQVKNNIYYLGVWEVHRGDIENL